MIIKANETNLTDVEDIYNRIFARPDKLRLCNWAKGKYPTVEIARAAIEVGNLYLFYEDGLLKGSVILDENQPPDYAKINWRYAAEPHDVTVIHTLCINPEFEGKGAGGRLLADIEAFSRKNGKKVIRFDTFYLNAPARRTYEKSGYSEVGTAYVFVYGESRLLRCFEKCLP